MRPSTPLSRFVLRLVAFSLFMGLATPLVAQSRSVTTPAAVLSAPNGKSIGSVHPGVSVHVLDSRGAYAKVTVEGFVERSRLSARKESGSPRIGSRSTVVRSRGASSAQSVGSFDAGTIVSLASGSAPSGWVKVKRDGWVLKTSLEKVVADAPRKATETKRTASTTKARTPDRKSSAGEVAAPPPNTKAATPAAAPAPVAVAATTKASTIRSLSDSTLVPIGNVALRAAPDAKPLATLAQGTNLVPLARDRGWVRVRVEGWVPEKDLAPADTSVRMGVSAADLRSDPVGAKGKVVRWSVQLLAKQKADVLRRDLTPDETYWLARGPYEENALLYLVVPPALMSSAGSLTELSQVLITARVRTGKSDLVGVPILDLLTITPRK
jgi:hypothetical protein